MTSGQEGNENEDEKWTKEMSELGEKRERNKYARDEFDLTKSQLKSTQTASLGTVCCVQFHNVFKAVQVCCLDAFRGHLGSYWFLLPCLSLEKSVYVTSLAQEEMS